MGCGASSSSRAAMEEMATPRPKQFKQAHPLVNEQASSSQRIKASEAIKKNDTFLINKMLQEITPLHNLGIEGENYTWLHVAAQFNSFSAMEVCIAWLKTNKPSEIYTIMCILGPDDQTPVVKAIMQDASETFYIMLREGAIPMNYKNEKGETIEQICRQHSFNCLHLLEKAIKGDQPDQKEEKPIKQEDAVKNPPQKIGDDATKELAIKKPNNDNEKSEKVPDTVPEQQPDQENETPIAQGDEMKNPSQKLVDDVEKEIKEPHNEVEELEKAEDQLETKVEKPIIQEDNVRNPSDDAAKELAIKKLNNAIGRLKHVSAVISTKNDRTQKSENNMPVELQGLPQQSQVYKILSELIKTGGEAFLDSNFPPSLSSIIVKNNHKNIETFKKSVWKRPHEILGCDYDQIQLFDGIEPNDISQGLLGICYFLASLSAITEFPSRLTSMFISKQANKYGVYGLQFYIKGIPTEIVVDDHIPCYGDRREILPIFSKPKGKELWLLLAEKAWAKLYKNYIECEAGQVSEALEYLLGTPSITHHTKDQDVNKIWEIILEADKNNHILCAGTYGNIKRETGLVGGHAYSLIAAYQVNNYRILKLRNPWGRFEWNGDFSDDSKLWTEEMKTKVGYVKADDGVFFMTVEDFKKNFEDYAIGIYNEGWEYTYTEVESDSKHAEYFKFTVDQPCWVYFRIHQTDKRYLSDEQEERFKYASGDLVIARIEDDTYQPITDDVDSGSIFGARSIYASKNQKLYLDKPGEYIIRTKLRWRQGGKDKFTLSAYAPVKIEMQHVKPIKGFLTKMLTNVAQKAMKPDNKNGCQKSYDYYANYMYIYLENTGQKKWTANINFKELKNLRLTKPYKKGETTLNFSLLPGQKAFAFLKKEVINTPTSFAWSFSSTLE